MKRHINLVQHYGFSIWLLTASDLKTIVIPKTIFGTLNALAAAEFNLPSTAVSSKAHILCRVPLTALWVWAILLPFVIDNQRQPLSIKEDKVNKPWRAIASGRLDKAEAKTLMLWLYAGSVIISWKLGGFPHAFIGMALGKLFDSSTTGLCSNYPRILVQRNGRRR
jgi:hypothetical protein